MNTTHNAWRDDDYAEEQAAIDSMIAEAEADAAAIAAIDKADTSQ